MHPIKSTALCALLFAGQATAITLHNKDSKPHNITIACGGSTVHSSIGSNTIRDIGNGPCKVGIKSGPSVSASGSDKLIIKNGGIGN